MSAGFPSWVPKCSYRLTRCGSGAECVNDPVNGLSKEVGLAGIQRK
jgi:hypothetical protein